VEGVTLENRIQWKRTIGDIAHRPGRWNIWGYHNTEGLGFHEYLQLCEDLRAAPLYVVNAGMSCLFRSPEVVTEPEQVTPFVQDTLDALEYANGPVTSKWGAERARNGHPKPFNIRFVEIGNENWGDGYFKNYRRFYDAIKAKYPGIITIADCPIPNQPVEIVDEHYYAQPSWFLTNSTKYDNYPRNGPRIYVGEYACNSPEVGPGNVWAAISEAAFMIGMERNSDIVIMASYAPLLENVNNRAWPVNLIRFDNSRCTGRSSFHVQTMFSANRPDVILRTEVTEPDKADPKAAGAVGPNALDLGKTNMPTVYALGGKDEKRRQIILKVVNPGATPKDILFRIECAAKLKPKAQITTLAGDKPDDENTLDEPNKVVPVKSTFDGVAAEFHYSVKPRSLTIFRIEAAK
jgi:alpha-L-arabinofuranosidase